MSNACRQVKTGVAAVGAGVLALSLVAAPPDADAVQTELRPVQLLAFAPSSTVLSAAIYDEYIRQLSQTALPVPQVVVAADRTVEGATIPLGLVRAVRSAGAATQLIDAPARSVVGPAIESQEVTNAAVASPGVITNPILRSIIAAGLFFVVIPAFWVIIIATSAINVVLDALGLPLLPNVPDPPFGPVPPLATATTTPTAESNPELSDPLVPQTNKMTGSTGGVEDNLSDPSARRANEPALLAGGVDKDVTVSDPVLPQRDQTAPAAAGVDVNAPSSDVVEHQPDITGASNPSSDTVKQSPRFTPKRRVRDSSSAAHASDQKTVESVADDASSEDQHPAGDSGQKVRKPKRDTADGEQRHDQSSKRGPS